MNVVLSSTLQSPFPQFLQLLTKCFGGFLQLLAVLPRCRDVGSSWRKQKISWREKEGGGGRPCEGQEKEEQEEQENEEGQEEEQQEEQEEQEKGRDAGDYCSKDPGSWI